MPGDQPLDVSLEQWAAVSAEIAEGAESLPVILARHGLDRDRWLRADIGWHRAVMIEAELGQTAIADAFTSAYSQAQDALRPVPVLTAEDWAALASEVASDGMSAASSRGLSLADYLRLSRHWAKVLAGNKSEANRYNQAFFALSRARGR